MIKFKYIRWKNFLSTGNNFIEIVLDRSKTTLVVGTNGAGKSTMLDALLFTLYNKPFRKINKPQLVNTLQERGLVCEVEFYIGNSHYKVVRGIKPNVFEVYLDGLLLNRPGDSRDYQEILENQILRIDYKSFCQVVVLGSAAFIPFMQLTTPHRREVIEDLLNLSMFSVMKSLLKERADENAIEVNAVQREMDLIREKIKIFSEHQNEADDDRAVQIDEKLAKIDNAKDQIRTITKQIATIETEIAGIRPLIASEKKIQNKANTLASYQMQAKSRLTAIKKELAFYEDNDNCPTCHQSIEATFKHDCMKAKVVEKDEVSDGLVEMANAIAEVNKELATIANHKSSITELEMELNKFHTRISALNSSVKELEKEIKALRAPKEKPSEGKIAELEQQLVVNEKTYNQLKDDKACYAATGVLLKDTGIKASVVKKFVPVINKLINDYLAKMEFFVEFELNENFEETIKSHNRDNFTYSSFSEGEKFRINLAIMFTWRALARLRASISTNLLILDEVMDGSLDAGGTEEFLKILNGLTEDNVFVISHKSDEISDRFDRVLKFEKVRNFSRCVESQ